VLVRTDLVGFVAPPDDYPYWVYPSRFYVFRPDGFAYRNPEVIRSRFEREVTVFTETWESLFGSSQPLIPPGLDLAGHPEYDLAHGRAYRDGEESVHDRSWSRLPGHLGARSLYADSAPAYQVIELPLTDSAHRVIDENDGFRIQLLYLDGETVIDGPLDVDDDEKLAHEILLSLKADTIITLTTLVRHTTAGRQSPTSMPGAGAALPMMPQRPQDRIEVAGDIRDTYILRIVRGSQLIHERPIVLDPGLKKAQTVTGTLTRSSSFAGIVLDPPLDLLRLEARWDGMQGGHRPRTDVLD
jgi:hypothetical protein